MPPLVMTYVASRSGQSVKRNASVRNILTNSHYSRKSRRQTWRVLNLSNALFTSTLAKKDPSRRGMSEDMTAHGLTTIGACKESAGSRIALHLIGLLGKKVR